jgi:broad specificity phosphatase PhoE
VVVTTLILTRHGETIWGAENRFAGSSDVELTKAGHDQASLLASWAVDAELDAVYSSTLVRAVRTAIPTARACHLELQQDQGLCEVDFGEAEGLTTAEMEARFGDRYHSWLAAPAIQPMPGGESGLDAIARANASLTRIRTDHPDGRVLVVMHGTLIRLLLCAYLGINPETYRHTFPVVDNVSLTTLRWDATGVGLLGYNARPVPIVRTVE